MAFNKVAIIGVGLLGGSLGLELRRKKMAKTIVGCGRNVANLKTAVRKKLINSYATDVAEAILDADCIILAAPVLTIENHLKIIAKKARPGTLVMDVGSTKVGIVKVAQKILPKNIFFVGAHPMAGTEKSGAEAALPDLFKGKKCILTPVLGTSKDALRLAVLFWREIGSVVIEVSPSQHDAILAYTSHLPQIISSLLMSVVAGGVKVSDIRNFSGSGLRDVTRLAASPTDMWRDILIANRVEILKSIRLFKKELSRLEQALTKKTYRVVEGVFIKARDSKINIQKSE